MSADEAIRQAGSLTVYGAFRARVRRHPDMLALEGAGVRRSYAELDDRVRRLSDALSRRGLGHGDRIAILSENRPEYLELELAAARLGAIVACQNWRLFGTELKHCITLVAPKLAIVSARFRDAFAALALPDLPALVIEDQWEDLVASGDPDSEDARVDPEDGLVILYTSGTTGLPKGALISHRAELARMTVMRLDLKIGEGEAFVAWAPFFHMISTDHALATLMSGGAVIVVDGLDVPAIVDAAVRHRIGWLVLMPGGVEKVVEHLERERPALKGVAVCGCMADLVPASFIKRATELIGAPYLNTFGSTECGLPPATASLLPIGVAPTNLSKRQNSLCAIRLLGPDGAEVADGEPGEVAIRGPTLFSGYWNAAETNARDFADGWFHTGDLCRRNQDGTIDFVDRAKYMIKSGGENIYPAEIERILLADPRVADAAVVKKPDAKWGEVPVAFVAAVDEALSAADIETLCRRELAAYKRPREVRFIPLADFPRSASGKIQRHVLEGRL